MKKLLTILISCSLALAAGAIAQQEEASPQPPDKKKQPPGEHQAREARPASEARPPKEVKPAAEAKVPNEAKALNEAKPMPKAESMHKEHVERMVPTEATGAPKLQSGPEAPAVTKVPEKDAALVGKGQAEQHKKEHNVPKEPATANKLASPAPVSAIASSPTPASVTASSPTPASVSASSATPASVTASSATPASVTASSATPAAAIAPSTAPAAPQALTANPPTNKLNAQAKKPDVQVVQKIQAEHANFKAQPKPEMVPTVTFNQSYRINGSDQWQGEKYERFRSYHPEMHDERYYHSHYSRVEVIGGGAYYWNDGYWYPAWGYNRSAQYYPYDGPIYVGHRAEPPDRVIANVQAILQKEGYYKGEVDGLLGPLTRQALTSYQADNGLYTTATIDEPTLASLDLG